MQRPKTMRTACAALLLVGLFGPPASAHPDPNADPTAVMKEHVATLRNATSEEMLRQLGTQGQARLEQALSRAEQALADGDWLQSLRPYARVAAALAPATVTLSQDPIEDQDGLTAESDALRSELEALGSPLAGRNERPAALQALLESSTSAAWAYLASAAVQGREAGLQAGVYYLKQARGHAEVAQMLASIEVMASDDPLGPVIGLSGYLDRLESELLDLYRPPLSQDRHATFIQLSANLKFAREMRDQGHELGALEEGLDLARALTQFSDDPSDRSDQSSSQWWPEVVRWRKQLEQTMQDSTLAQVWLADARVELDGENPDLALVAALFERVLTDYVEVTKATAPAATAKVTGHQVTVTLVRWPFT